MIICISGPTCIGKTKLSVELAKKYDGVVINADATQIYKELNIGSAKITDKEKDGVEHYLFDIKNPNEDYSVCDYQKDGRLLLEKFKNRNIIVVGGTGLYIKALFEDYEFSNIDNDVDYSNYNSDELYLLAKKIDNNLNIDKNNRVRLVNFLRRGGNVHSDKSLYDVIYIGLTCDRSILYDRVNNRVDLMFENGLIEEVKDLYNRYPDSNILKRAIGYKEVISYLNNEISLEQAKDLIKKNTRHYVKRQYTWFNNQMKLNYFNVDFNNFYKTIYEVGSFIDSLNSK